MRGSCLPWKRTGLAYPGGGRLLALEEGWSCLPWKRAGLACPGRGLVLLALEEGCSCLPWKRAVLACPGGGSCLPWRRRLILTKSCRAGLACPGEGLCGGVLACLGGEWPVRPCLPWKRVWVVVCLLALEESVGRRLYETCLYWLGRV